MSRYSWLLLTLIASPSASSGQVFWEDTRLADFQIGSVFETTTTLTARRGYELENGQFQRFREWYSNSWRDVKVVLETPIGKNQWFLWGMTTGEQAEKYIVQPSLILGYQSVFAVTDHSFFTFGLMAKFGGNLEEKSCTAKYSLTEISVPVNCRLAASLLPPAQTLEYLWNIDAPDRLQIDVGYIWYF